MDAAGAQRTIPFEVMVPGDKIPVYEETLEDNGRFNDQPALPFNAYGTMALARGEFETNSGSSQFFFLLKVGWPLEICPRKTEGLGSWVQEVTV